MHRGYKRPDWAKGLTVNVSDEVIQRKEREYRQRAAEKANTLTRNMGRAARRKRETNEIMGN